MLHRQFKRDTVKGLIKLVGEIPHQQMRRGRQPTNAADLGRLSRSAGGHFLERIPPTEKEGQAYQKLCSLLNFTQAQNHRSDRGLVASRLTSAKHARNLYV